MRGTDRPPAPDGGMIIDDHAYWDAAHLSLEALARQMRQHRLSRVILSPPCTQGYEPDKSPVMYAVQRFLLRRAPLRRFAELASHSFYDEEGHLRPAWRLFTRHRNPIQKVLVPDNERLLSALAPFERLYAWYWVNPASRPPRERVEAGVRHPRVVGLKLHAYWHTFTLQDARPVFELAQRTGKPIYFILGFHWMDPAVELLREFPTVNVIFGYGGFPYFDALWSAIRPHANARVDCASFHLDQQILRAAVKALGPARCLYGSDCPYNFKGADGGFDYAHTIDRVATLPMSEDGRRRILFQNAQEILFHGEPTDAVLDHRPSVTEVVSGRWERPS